MFGQKRFITFFLCLSLSSTYSEARHLLKVLNSSQNNHIFPHIIAFIFDRSESLEITLASDTFAAQSTSSCGLQLSSEWKNKKGVERDSLSAPSN